MAKDFALDYIDVATRIVEFREKYPTGSLQQVSLDFREFGGNSWVIFTAAAFRTPDDERPGMGTAWEPVPGKTPFTKDSELQNAETAAWGRAIVAVLAADTRRGISSAEEVRNRQDAAAEGLPAAPPPPSDWRNLVANAQHLDQLRGLWEAANQDRWMSPEVKDVMTARRQELENA